MGARLRRESLAQDAEKSETASARRSTQKSVQDIRQEGKASTVQQTYCCSSSQHPTIPVVVVLKRDHLYHLCSRSHTGFQGSPSSCLVAKHGGGKFEYRGTCAAYSSWKVWQTFACGNINTCVDLIHMQMRKTMCPLQRWKGALQARLLAFPLAVCFQTCLLKMPSISAPCDLQRRLHKRRDKASSASCGKVQVRIFWSRCNLSHFLTRVVKKVNIWNYFNWQ